ncbi:hypothetical protein [Apilactobacillus xinyiensis]|uniref:hypothetical protein n=1 Tax=Apilactobacillus xinyiensis TaxID=2841032 RepID=UPI00200EB35A|nr:hypothetical protein [Apilactobacillus xinyiensis]MCL0330591.1 hypothetical protein [Apilactobacillus xinyiensis]
MNLIALKKLQQLEDNNCGTVADLEDNHPELQSIRKHMGMPTKSKTKITNYGRGVIYTNDDLMVDICKMLKQRSKIKEIETQLCISVHLIYRYIYEYNLYHRQYIYRLGEQVVRTRTIPQLATYLHRHGYPDITQDKLRWAIYHSHRIGQAKVYRKDFYREVKKI